jgi:ketosteroid isomerase-like protein
MEEKPKQPNMNDAEGIVAGFYTAFQKKDWRGMQGFYHDDVIFSDPVFQNLKGKRAKAMWHMLAEAAKDLTINFKNVQGDGQKGSCDWNAYYSFSRTGRKVHNIIHGQFELKDGKIFRHTDTFDLWRWSGMAMGTMGKLMGWTSFFQSKIRATADKNLERFIANHREYQG